MQDHTADSIKSLEGFNIAWFEEASRMSARSLELLIPTRGDFIDTGDAVYGGEYPLRLVVRAALTESLPGAVGAGG